MFGIGSTEFIVILLVALLVLGPTSLAKISRTVGKYMGEFRRVSTEFQRTLNVEAAEEERKEAKEAVKKKAEAARAGRERRQKALKGSGDTETASVSPSRPVPESRPESEKPASAAAEAVVAEGPVAPKGSPLEEALKKSAAEAGSAVSSGENKA